MGRNWALIPFDLGVFLSKSSALIFLSSTFAIAIVIFLMPSTRLLATLRLSCLFAFLLALIALPIHWFLAATFLVLGSIILSFAIIRRSEKNVIDDDMSSSFLWQRLSDLFMFVSLLLILAQQKTLSLLLLPKTASTISQSYLIAFFLACALRLLPISRKKSAQSYVYFRASFIEDAFVSLGIVLMLLRLKDVVFYSDNANYVLIISALLIFLRTTINKFSETFQKVTVLNSFFTALSLILMCFKLFYLVEVLLALMVLFVATALLVASKKKDAPARITFGMQNTIDPLAKLAEMTQALVRFCAETSATIISPFYTNFLLYRLPQFIVTIFQIPLRLFHNGSIQRSLLFIITMLASYYWLWGR